MAAARLVLGWCLSAAAGLAGATDGPPSVLATLAQAGEVSCQPALPVFCSNIHVSCSGPSAIRTFAFTLRASGVLGSIESAADTSGIGPLYAKARAEWSTHDGTVILWPQQGPGYIKLLADGRYSFRHYGEHTATMSHGQCR
ncbi:MAG TPA: hypothetical protein VI032_10820 [Burkholderiaceae bacterium]